MSSEWIEEEVADSTMPDERLKGRLGKTLEKLSHCPERSIPASCSDWGDTLGTYRLLDNERLTPEAILSGHRAATVRRMDKEAMVLVAQDTTEVTFKRHYPIGMGTLKAPETERHYWHSSVALTAGRVNLGGLKSTCWQRLQRLTPQQRRRPERRPLAERESARWVAHFADDCDLPARLASTLVVMLADREGDMHDIFEHAQAQPEQARASDILRAKSDRATLGEHLWDEVACSPILGTLAMRIGRRGNKPARDALLVLRARTVTFSGSKNYRRTPVTVHAVYALEVNPLAGEDPVEWLLITDLEAGDFEQARTIVEWYTVRWEIEIFFRVLKQGCHIEELRLQTARRVHNALAVYQIIAWRVHAITMLSRAYPASPASLVFTDVEWQTIYLMQTKKPPPPEPPCLGETARQLAQLGGFLARKGDGKPGVQSFWIGYQRLMDYIHALQISEQLRKRSV